jgi:hypothetical protein
MLKVTMEFYTPEEAIVALSKLIGLDKVKITNPLDPKPTRKGRADAGKPRGPYKTGDGPQTAAPVVPGPETQSPAPATHSAATPAEPAGTIPAQAPAADPLADAAEATKAALLKTQALNPTGFEKIEYTQVSDALEKVINAKGVPAARALLTKFKIGRLAVLPKEEFRAFLEAAQKVIA